VGSNPEHYRVRRARPFGRELLELDLLELLEPEEPDDERLARPGRDDFDDLLGKGMPRPPEERRLD
jgi:hypothetical protein